MSTQEENRLDSPTAGPEGSSDKPEPDEADKKKAAEMMHVYDDENRPTLVLPGTGGAVSGTAVNDWLDENGDPKYGKDGPANDAKAADNGAGEDGAPEYMTDEMIANDKEYNESVIKECKARAGRDEDAANREKAATK